MNHHDKRSDFVDFFIHRQLSLDELEHFGRVCPASPCLIFCFIHVYVFSDIVNDIVENALGHEAGVVATDVNLRVALLNMVLHEVL